MFVSNIQSSNCNIKYSVEELISNISLCSLDIDTGLQKPNSPSNIGHVMISYLRSVLFPKFGIKWR